MSPRPRAEEQAGGLRPDLGDGGFNETLPGGAGIAAAAQWRRDQALDDGGGPRRSVPSAGGRLRRGLLGFSYVGSFQSWP
eukprot:2934432-Pyramimonas_sp.AAC.1